MNEKHRFCLPVPIDLVSLQHQIDLMMTLRNGSSHFCRGPIVCGHADHIFDVVRGAQIAQNVLGGELTDAVRVRGFGFCSPLNGGLSAP